MVFDIGNLVVVGGVGLAFRQSNLAGKAIVALLLVGSIFAWTVMLTKWRELHVGHRLSVRFLQGYRREGHPAAVFLKRGHYEGSPLFAIYERACAALASALDARGVDREELFMGGVASERRQLDEVQISAIRNVAERTMADQALLLENKMGLLATAASAAPFLGLLGTVWGVMEAFGGMAVSGTALLADVAPGISGALLTTVVGLLVALPSAVGYNLLSDQVRRCTVELDNFSQELASDIERHYAKRS